VHLVGFTIEIYYDARSYKRQSGGVVHQLLAETFGWYFKAVRTIILLVDSKIQNFPPKWMQI
jgi:hypothetical protein